MFLSTRSGPASCERSGSRRRSTAIRRSTSASCGFYFDGETTARLTADADEFFTRPLAEGNHQSTGGFASWQPIAFTSRLRITVEQPARFYPQVPLRRIAGELANRLEQRAGYESGRSIPRAAIDVTAGSDRLAPRRRHHRRIANYPFDAAHRHDHRRGSYSNLVRRGRKSGKSTCR